VGDALSTAGWGAGELTVQQVVVSAYAKINLTLEVLGKRPDGLHEVATVMQTISLADRLVCTSAGDITLRHRGLKPDGDDDLIYRAAVLLRGKSDSSAGCAIECLKRIPVAAGLGGGSADAAATLRALNELWGTGLRRDDLLQIAGELGADVPFGIEGGTAMATGSGRDLKLLPDAPLQWVVLAPIASDDPRKTAEMYARLVPADITGGAAARQMGDSVAAGRVDYAAICSAFNRVAADRWPRTASALRVLSEAGADAVSVSGAGPSVFAVYEKRAPALSALARLRAEGLLARLCRFVPRRPAAAFARGTLS
jgi:4-diphosphocytidyl-2-C-methyl-D-erythritol kinase